jgi:hypothetical protein
MPSHHSTPGLLLALFATAAASSSSLLPASYRKDLYLDDYVEGLVPAPLDGGRLHIVGAAQGTGLPSQIFLNGSYLNMSTGLDPNSEWMVDWVRAEPLLGFVAGGPVWVSLHSRLPALDAAASSGALTSLLILDAAGAVLLNGSFAIAVPPARVTWVTTSDARTSLHLFVRNEAAAAAAAAAAEGGNLTATSVVLNGVDVTSSLPAAALTVAAGRTAMWVLPASVLGGASAVAPGSVWTLVVTWQGGSGVTAAGGLLFREQYPVETWEHGSDCPFPGINTTAYNIHRTVLGVDTFFSEYRLDSACATNLTSIDLINTVAPKYGFYMLPSAEIGQAPIEQVTNTSGLAGWFLADEDDTVVDDKARLLLANHVRVRAAFPDVPTYAGGASNRYSGAYSGITDVKGMDAYIGACAPHYPILPLRASGSWEYLHNLRANHAPGPSWLYTQGFEDGWRHEQASPAEMAIQVLSVPAAGAKGLMIFETQLSFSEGPAAAAFATMGTLLREVGALRELYRGGDATDSAVALNSTGGVLDIDTVIVQSTFHPRAVVLTLISTLTPTTTVDIELCCAIPGTTCHFAMTPQVLQTVFVPLPQWGDFAVVDSFEVFNATVLPGTVPSVTPSGDGLALTNVALGSEGPGSPPCTSPAASVVRTFVFAADAALRGEVAAALLPVAPIPPSAGEEVEKESGSSSSSSAAAAQPVAWWQSARNTTDRLTPQAGRSFSSAMPAPAVSLGNATNATAVTVDFSSTFQTIVGFGGAITESAVYNFNLLDAATQQAVVDALYGDDGNGTSLRYTFGRLTIGSCDFALQYYNYNEQEGDVNMTAFSIAHDEEAIIPFILRAQAAVAGQNRTLQFLSSPWSPPAWMKVRGGGQERGGEGARRKLSCGVEGGGRPHRVAHRDPPDNRSPLPPFPRPTTPSTTTPLRPCRAFPSGPSTAPSSPPTSPPTPCIFQNTCRPSRPPA